MTTALDGFLDELPDPDMIGDSAYRVLHEEIHDIVESSRYDKLSDTETLEIIVGDLDNVISWAHDIKDIAARHLRQHPDPADDAASSSDMQDGTGDSHGPRAE
jgi:hypothetical protein